jgi:hypothetical protein
MRRSTEALFLTAAVLVVLLSTIALVANLSK